MLGGNPLLRSGEALALLPRAVGAPLLEVPKAMDGVLGDLLNPSMAWGTSRNGTHSSGQQCQRLTAL